MAATSSATSGPWTWRRPKTCQQGLSFPWSHKVPFSRAPEGKALGGDPGRGGAPGAVFPHLRLRRRAAAGLRRFWSGGPARGGAIARGERFPPQQRGSLPKPHAVRDAEVQVAAWATSGCSISRQKERGSMGELQSGGEWFLFLSCWACLATGLMDLELAATHSAPCGPCGPCGDVEGALTVALAQGFGSTPVGCSGRERL